MLDGEELRDSVLKMLREVVQSNVSTALADAGADVTEESFTDCLRQFEGIYFAKGAVKAPEMLNAQTVTDAVYAKAVETYEKKEAQYTPAVMRELERVIMLRVVDEYWMDNIDAMDDLKQGIGLRAYGQHDPVIAYKEEGYEMFQAMITAIREETVRRMFLVQLRPRQEVKREKVAKETSAAGADTPEIKKVPVRKTKHVGPNDPCPCGSGKKYKKCCRDKDIAAGLER